MTPKTLQALDRRLQQFLEDLTEPLGRRERRHGARVYLEGLLLDGERKSMEPMAARVGADVQALRQFLGQSPWEVEEVQRRLARKVVDLLSEPELWIIDETAFPKAGEHSVGVARQYCGTLGKVANCQVAVSLHWSSAETSCPILWRLYLPKEWLEDAERAAEVRLPSGTAYRSKTELALEVIDQARGWELPRLPVVADSFYGNEFGFRHGACPTRCRWSRRRWFGPRTPIAPGLPRSREDDRGSIRRWRFCRGRRTCERWPSSCLARFGEPWLGAKQAEACNARASPGSPFGRLTAGENRNTLPGCRNGCCWNGRRNPKSPPNTGCPALAGSAPSLWGCGGWCASPRPAGAWSWITAN